MIAISKYNKQHPLRVFEAFAGYGSQSLAFKYLKDKHPEFDFKVVGYSEIEPSAIQAYGLLHGSIEDYESEIQMGRDIHTAYNNSLEGTVESEFADVCIRILSLLGWMDIKKPTKFQSDYYLKEEYEIAKIKYKYDIAKCFYNIISFLCSFTDNNSPYWYISKIIQKTLMQVFALSHNNNIDLMEHIKLKMQYNESRPYLHGCKY